jgi:hypothetical protein
MGKDFGTEQTALLFTIFRNEGEKQMKRYIAVLLVWSFCLTGCSMKVNLPFGQKQTKELSAETESLTEVPENETETENEGGVVQTAYVEEWPEDLYAESDRIEALLNPPTEPIKPISPAPSVSTTPTPTATPTPTQKPTPTPTPKLSPQQKAIKVITESKNIDDFIKALHEEHDNSQFGMAYGLNNYVGQLALNNVAFCVSDINGIEEDDVMEERLNHKFIQREFVYMPEYIEEAHEYYDIDGTLLFTIQDMDFTDGKSTGKHRILLPGSDVGITCYDDDVDIFVLETFDALPESEKSKIGDRTGLTDKEKKANIKKNHELYNETKVLSDYVDEDIIKSAKKVALYHPKSRYANADGYVEIPVSSAYAKRLLNMRYIRKRHIYKLNNIKHYAIFKDKNGKPLFTFNQSNKTKGIDLYRKDKNMTQGYRKGKVIPMYPEYVDIEKELKYEKKLKEKENAQKTNSSAS